jgi:hypothetical protein
VDLTADILDSRDIIARIDYLATDEDDLDDEERDELRILRAVAEQADSYGDWQYGESLIRDSHFPEYAQELAEDIGAITSGAPWPLNCIDWDEAADQLKQDYMSVDIDGTEYWMRA